MSVLRLELREVSSACEEVVVSGVELLDGELEALRVHFLHPRQGLLQFGQYLAVPVVVAGLLLGQVLFLAGGEEVVVDVPDRPEVLGEQRSLGAVGIQPHPVSVHLRGHVFMLVLLAALVSGAGFGFRYEKSVFRKKVVGADFRAGLVRRFSLSLLVLNERRR